MTVPSHIPKPAHLRQTELLLPVLTIELGVLRTVMVKKDHTMISALAENLDRIHPCLDRLVMALQTPEHEGKAQRKLRQRGLRVHYQRTAATMEYARSALVLFARDFPRKRYSTAEQSIIYQAIETMITVLSTGLRLIGP